MMTHPFTKTVVRRVQHVEEKPLSQSQLAKLEKLEPPAVHVEEAERAAAHAALKAKVIPLCAHTHMRAHTHAWPAGAHALAMRAQTCLPACRAYAHSAVCTHAPTAAKARCRRLARRGGQCTVVNGVSRLRRPCCLLHADPCTLRVVAGARAAESARSLVGALGVGGGRPCEGVCSQAALAVGASRASSAACQGTRSRASTRQ